MTDSPASPCIGICELDSQDICQGCLRTRGEITAWFSADVREKNTILAAVSIRQKDAADNAYR